MKKIILFITALVLTLSCATKKVTTSNKTEKNTITAVDSLTTEINTLLQEKKQLKDSIAVYQKIVSEKETTIIKASKLQTEVESLCDSLGNLKDFSQTLGNDDFKLKLIAANGKLQVISEQINDLVSVKETLEIENSTLKTHISTIEKEYTQKITTLESKVLAQQKVIEEYKSQEITKVKWSSITWWFLLGNIFQLLIILLFIRGALVG